MGDEPSKPRSNGAPPEAASRARPGRAMGAALLVVVSVGVLWIGDELWLTDVEEDTPRTEVRLDLAEAARFAAHERAASGAAPRRNGERIVVPTGAAIAWTVRVPPSGAFAALRIEAGGRAELHVASDDLPERAWPFETCAGGCRIPLEGFAGEVVRLTARGPAPGERPAGPLVLDGPVLEGAPPGDPPAIEAVEGRPPVIVYLMDTLRADKLGAYGSDRGLTPEIDAFANGATVFDHAIAQAPWTKPSVASIFTGVFARAHRIVTMAGVLPDSASTLAELFLAHGYATGAVVTNGLVDAEFGFDQGFDAFIRERGRAPDVEGVTGFRADKPAIDSDIAQARVWPWLDGLAKDEPFLLYIHVLDPHTPHFPPEPFKSRFVPELDRFDLGSMESVRALDAMGAEGQLPDARTRRQLETLYDAEVAHNDHQFGLFLDELRARGIHDDALIVLVSDHGEAFWEHGRRGHGKTLHEELLRVPLIVKAPGQRQGRRVAALAQHVDLLPTLAEYAGIDAPEGLHGTSLRPLIELGDAAREGLEPVIGVSASSFGTAIREGRYKVVKRRSAHHPLALYDLEADPGETNNLAAERPILARYLLEEVARREARTPALDAAPRERAISAEKAEELRALGYVE